MKREFSLKQIMQMILVCLLLVAVVYIFYRADHAELSQLNGPVTVSQGAAPLENESDPALRSFTYLLDKGESTEYYLNYEDNPVMRYIANYKTFEASDGTQQRVLMSFQVPPAGKEADNLSLLVSTQSYPDVMSMTYFGGSLAELYEAGNILDLGPYIDQYMPNYKAWLEANPQVIATTPVGDQNLHLTLTGIRANLSAYDLFAGWCYRRDWIVRYGVQPDTLFDPMADSEPRPNPKAGQTFSGHYTLDKDGNAIESATLEKNVNGDSWVDDVIFPSGNTDPIYISDWEWMFEIFERALKEQGIEFDAKPISCSGIEECRMALLKAKVGKLDANFIEGMACIGGCVNGAGSLTHSAKNQQLVEKHGKEAERKTIQDSISHPDASFKH